MALPVEIVRSKKRRKTVTAVLGDGVIRVHVPVHLTQAQIDEYVADLAPKLERRYRSEHIDLDERARVLARRYRLPRPDSIEWADSQRKKWGTCDPVERHIRISTRLASCPPWVLDYVIVHELVHLVVPHHQPPFSDLVDRYPRAERARGYLLAKEDDARSPERDPEPGPEPEPGRALEPEPAPAPAPTSGTLELWSPTLGLDR